MFKKGWKNLKKMMVGLYVWYLDLNDQFFHFDNIQSTCVVNSQEQIFEAINPWWLVQPVTSPQHMKPVFRH